VFQGHLYFAVQFDRMGLWRTDGTAAGTRRVLRDVYPRNLLATSKRLFFVGLDVGGGCAMEDLLWTSDGTTAGTRHVAPFATDGGVVAFQGRAYFAMGTGAAHRLYRNSGTWLPHGTVKPKVAVDPGTRLQVVGGRLFLSQAGGLSISDGTGVGTIRLGDTESGFVGLVDVAKAGGLWYFPGGFANGGTDLWQTDGTVEGTRMAAAVDLTGSHDLRSLVRSGGTIWFSAHDGAHGRELWRYTP
jgi:ELWxxDGT repeat protein